MISGWRGAALLGLTAIGAVCGVGQAASAHMACSDMLRLQLPNATVATAEVVAPGTFREPGGDRQHGDFSDLPAFCRVHGSVHPAAGSNIGFEVWLPLRKWSGRLHMVGNGAYMSMIYWPELANRIRQGDVGVATDMGDQGGSLTFAVGHPRRVIDWGQRAVHATVTIAKLVVKAYFGSPARYSYFSGCSTGGEQALSGGATVSPGFQRNYCR